MPHLFLFIALLSFFSTQTFAHNTPKGSSYDARMQRVPYNKEDVTTINTRLGFVTTIIFDDDEVVEKAISGFDVGWSITPYQNKLFISAVPVEQEFFQEHEPEVDNAAVKRFEPSTKDWRTNLFVSTNKRSYSMDLNITPQGVYAHVVRYGYPEKKTADRDKQKIAAELAQDKYPRNWNYHFKKGAASENIVPELCL